MYNVFGKLVKFNNNYCNSPSAKTSPIFQDLLRCPAVSIASCIILLSSQHYLQIQQKMLITIHQTFAPQTFAPQKQEKTGSYSPKEDIVFMCNEILSNRTINILMNNHEIKYMSGSLGEQEIL